MSMTLDEFLSAEGAPSAADLAREIGIKDAAQVRAWRHGYGDRLPSPENCVAIQVATKCKVMRWDLRPADWHRIWPELIGAEGAPSVPTTATAAG